MILERPLALLAVLPVAAVAAYALCRPDRPVTRVSSLKLWSDALAATPADAQERGWARRISLTWFLLLLGTLCAVLALAGPTRFVAVERAPAALGALGPSRPLRVAVVGQGSESLCEFASAFAACVAPGADLGAAEAVLSCGEALPARVPGIVFDPPEGPEGWRRADAPSGPLVLADASARPGEAMLRHVDFAGSAVRRARPFVRIADATGVPILSAPEGVLILAAENPRRVFVAFTLDAGNTNWPDQESFVIFLAEALRWIGADPALTRPQEAASAAVRAEGCSLTAHLASMAGALWLAGWAIQGFKRRGSVTLQ